MVKKIKKNHSYSYNDRVLKNNGSVKSPVVQRETYEDLDHLNYEEASLVKRGLAYIIDLILYVPLAMIIGYASIKTRTTEASSGFDSKSFIISISGVCLALIMFGYIPRFWKGQTIGRKLVGIKLVPTDNKKIDLFRYIVRDYLCKTLLAVIFIPFSLIFVIVKFIAKRDRYDFPHDFIWKTKEIDLRKEIVK